MFGLLPKCANKTHKLPKHLLLPKFAYDLVLPIFWYDSKPNKPGVIKYLNIDNMIFLNNFPIEIVYSLCVGFIFLSYFCCLSVCSFWENIVIIGCRFVETKAGFLIPLSKKNIFFKKNTLFNSVGIVRVENEGMELGRGTKQQSFRVWFMHPTTQLVQFFKTQQSLECYIFWHFWLRWDWKCISAFERRFRSWRNMHPKVSPFKWVRTNSLEIFMCDKC